MNAPARHRALLDLVCGIGLCGAFVLWRTVPASRIFAAFLAVLVVSLFAMREARSGVRSLAAIGLRFDNFADSLRLSTITLLPLVVCALCYAFFFGIHRPVHFLLAVLAYIPWGLLQQIFFQGFLLESLRTLETGPWSILLTSALFAAVHYPSNFLVAATAIGGPLFSITYFIRPNTVILAVYHGVLGASLYYIFRHKDVFEFLST